MTTLKSQTLSERRWRAVPRGITSATSLFIERAGNAEVWDTDGRRHIDFASGIAVLNTGHCHPQVVSAVMSQLRAYGHAAFQVMAYEPYIALAEKLNELAPVRRPAKTIFFSTGAEAVENAIKIARSATRRSAVVAFSGAFHGRTLFALSLTGKAAPYKQGFGPPATEVYRLPFPILHQGVSVEHSLAALEQLFRNDAPPNRIAAIIIEPIQGEGGFHPAPPSLLAALRKICDAHGILLIADEIQTGFARTGRMFALEHSNLEADMLVVAKALAGGMPLSGVIGRSEVMDAPEPGGLGGTYGGSPLACAAAIAVLDVIASQKLCARAEELGSQVRRRLAAMQEDASLVPIGHIRGLGAMIGFDLLMVRGEHAVHPGAATAVSKLAHSLGLIVLACGMQSEAIRLLFPLTASEAVVDEGLDILERALRRP